MRKDITIAAEPRDSRGKNAARRLRATGVVPAVLYGGQGQPEPVAVSPKELTRILHSTTGHNTIFNLDVAAKENAPVMIIDWQYDPVKDTLLHVDLKRIDLTKRLHVKVPVVTHGDPRGVKQQGGLLEVVTREIEIECLPDDIPEQFNIDVSELLIGQNVRASEVPLAGSMKLLSPGDAVIAHVVSLKAEAVEAAPAEPVAAAPAEPEVIKKGKKETEGAEPAKKK
ncbi:MAG: 50S ribosomal protein L25 [Bryobacteraceae bacterium]